MTQNSPVKKAEHSADGITIVRTINAPREAVWKAQTTPALFAQWFGEPGSEIPLETLD